MTHGQNTLDKETVLFEVWFFGKRMDSGFIVDIENTAENSQDIVPEEDVSVERGVRVIYKVHSL